MNADVNNENSSSVLPAEYSEVAPVALPKTDVLEQTTKLAVIKNQLPCPLQLRKNRGD